MNSENLHSPSVNVISQDEHTPGYGCQDSFLSSSETLDPEMHFQSQPLRMMDILKLLDTSHQ